jgi:hypothetical protein
MKQRRCNYTRTLLAVACGFSLNLPTLLLGAEGTAAGEHTDQPGQQGIGVSGGGAPGGPASSNVVMGGPEIVVGQISQIDGDRYSVVGDRGQEISLRVTKGYEPRLCRWLGGPTSKRSRDQAGTARDRPDSVHGAASRSKR